MAAVEEGVADEENVANDEDTLLEGDIAEPIEEEVREPLPPLTPIVFGVPKLKEGSAVSGALIQERERHLQRSQKFGVDYVEPKKELAVSRAELRTELARQRAKGHTGFATGIDLFSEEELAKKRVRAHKFQLATGEEAPADREARERAERQEKARKRIERFGKPDNDSLATAAEPPADPMEAEDIERVPTACMAAAAGKPFAKGQLKLPISLRAACVGDVKPATGTITRDLWVTPGAGPRRGRRIPRPQRHYGAPLPSEMAGAMGEYYSAAGGEEDEEDEEAGSHGGEELRGSLVESRKRRRGGDDNMDADEAEEEEEAAGGAAAAAGPDLRAHLARKGTSVEEGSILVGAAAVEAAGAGGGAHSGRTSVASRLGARHQPEEEQRVEREERLTSRGANGGRPLRLAMDRRRLGHTAGVVRQGREVGPREEGEVGRGGDEDAEEDGDEDEQDDVDEEGRRERTRRRRRERRMAE
eukprot:jgi/Mesen1/11065/ME000099S10521